MYTEYLKNVKYDDLNKLEPFEFSSINSDIINVFEKCFNRFFGTQNVISTCNGTNAILLALNSIDMKPYDDIIVTNFGWSGILTPMKIKALNIKFINFRPNSFSINCKLLKRIITKKTKALFITIPWGYPLNFEEINCLAKENELITIYDISQSIGTLYNDKFLFNIGDIVISSFGFTKELYLGEGGVISFRSKYKYENCLKNCTHPVRINHLLYNKKRKNFDMIFNARMNVFSAFLGIQALKDFQSYLDSKYLSFQKELDNLSKNSLNEYINIYNYNKTNGKICTDRIPFILNNQLIDIKHKYPIKEAFIPTVSRLRSKGDYNYLYWEVK